MYPGNLYNYQRSNKQEVSYPSPLQQAHQNFFNSRVPLQNAHRRTPNLENNRIVAEETVFHWVREVLNPESRTQALHKLFDARELYDNLPVILWHSFGVTACLVQEIITLYSKLDPPNIDQAHAKHICHVMGLLQVMANHPQTKVPLCCSQLPALLFPFIEVKFDSRPYEMVRLSALGVFAILSKNITPKMTDLFTSTDILPLCIKVMSSFSESQRSVALLILQRVLYLKEGLDFFCTPYERLQHLLQALDRLVVSTASKKTRFHKNIVYIYSRLADNHNCLQYLKHNLPMPVRDGTFGHFLIDDINAKRSLENLLYRTTVTLPSHSRR